MDEEIIYKAVVRALATMFSDEGTEDSKRWTPYPDEQDKEQEKSFSREDYDKAVDFAVKKHNQRTTDALLAYTEILIDAKKDYEWEVTVIRDAFYTRDRGKINKK